MKKLTMLYYIKSEGLRARSKRETSKRETSERETSARALRHGDRQPMSNKKQGYERWHGWALRHETASLNA